MGAAIAAARRDCLRRISPQLDVRAKDGELVTGPTGLEVAWKVGEGTINNELIDRSLVHASSELNNEAKNHAQKPPEGEKAESYVGFVGDLAWDPPPWLHRRQRLSFPRSERVVFYQDVMNMRGVASPMTMMPTWERIATASAAARDASSVDHAVDPSPHES